MLDVAFPDMIVRGEGTISAPPLTDSDITAMRSRADAIEDQQIKTDLFRLLAAVESLRDS